MKLNTLLGSNEIPTFPSTHDTKEATDEYTPGASKPHALPNDVTPTIKEVILPFASNLTCNGPPESPKQVSCRRSSCLLPLAQI